MSITAMKQMVEALEEARRDPRLKYEHPFYDNAITAGRQAIEQAERHEHEFVCGECVKCGASIEKQEPVARMQTENVIDKDYLWDEKITVNFDGDGQPLYTTPPAAPVENSDELTIAYMSGLHDGKKQREWVGLTDEEMHACWDSPLTPLGMKHARMIEAELKRKNT